MHNVQNMQKYAPKKIVLFNRELTQIVDISDNQSI